jgi:rhodanese-related sulfurtransferase
MQRLLEFTSAHALLVSAFLISFFLLAFTELRRKANKLLNVDPAEAVSLINKEALIIDLRSSEAFARGHIVNAKNVPADEFASRQDAVLGSKSKPVIAVCESGVSSNKTVAEMRKAGFQSAFGLEGGMTAWTQAGLPVVTGKKTKSKGKGKNKSKQ